MYLFLFRIEHKTSVFLGMIPTRPVLMTTYVPIISIYDMVVVNKDFLSTH